MNNLNTIGQYMSTLQQNISLLAQGLMELRLEVDSLKKHGPTNNDSVNLLRQEFEGKFSKLDQIIKTTVDSAIESIFATLQSSHIIDLHQKNVNDTINVTDPITSINQSDPSDSDDTITALTQSNDDIEIVAKKTPASKKKTTKKSVNA